METFLSHVPNLLMVTSVLVYMILIGFVLTWIYFDAERRGVLGWLVVPLVFLSGSSVLGALAWLLLRPKLKPQPIPVPNR